MRAIRPAGWSLDAALIAGFVLVSACLGIPTVRQADLAVRDASDHHRSHGMEVAVTWVNRLGSGGALTVLALAIAVVLAWKRRSLWPVAPVIVAFLITVAAITPLKLLFHRAAPHSPLPDDVEVRLFSQAGGLSYPSGHAVTTVVWYGVMCLLLAPWLHPALRTWVRVIPPVIVGLAATYLGFHWLTDMVAGLLLGVVITRLIDRLGWPALPVPLPVPQPSQPAHSDRSDAEDLDASGGERGQLGK
jgi:membrane-associated phospholipid phosphatase